MYSLRQEYMKQLSVTQANTLILDFQPPKPWEMDFYCLGHTVEVSCVMACAVSLDGQLEIAWSHLERET